LEFRTRAGDNATFNPKTKGEKRHSLKSLRGNKIIEFLEILEIRYGFFGA
jgi:hypothetical protein